MPYKLENIPYLNTLVANENINYPRVQVMGVDVCHLPGQNSMVALSATTNAPLTTFYNDFKIVGKEKRNPNHKAQLKNHAHVEIISFLSLMVIQAVRAYITKTGKAPTNLILYRDGVADSQIKDVHREEVQRIREDLNKQFPLESIDLSVILCTKRINHRFFQKGTMRVNNPLNGLIIESHVVKEDVFDWFMVAQHVT